MPALVDEYKQLHQHPELSGHEEKTSAFIAVQLKTSGYTVTEHAGKFVNRSWKGYGVIAMLKNGYGPVVLIRTDMDALPLVEKTGLPYASIEKIKNNAGDEVPVNAKGKLLERTALEYKRNRFLKTLDTF